MEEARKLGDDIERIKEAKTKVQSALEALKLKLREAETQAATDPGGQAQTTVTTLRDLLALEEPKLVQLLKEKQQTYELDYGRLSELKRELAHLKHGEDKLSAAIQTEFEHWHKAVEERYPGSTKPANTHCADAAGVGTSSSSSSPAPRSSPCGPPPPLPRAQPSPSPAAAPSVDAMPSPTPGQGGHLKAAASLSEGNFASTSCPPEKSAALARAEAALQSLRQRLDEARQNGDLHRVQMLEQLLSVEEPRIERLRTEGNV
jgi:hypothetical protein